MKLEFIKKPEILNKEEFSFVSPFSSGENSADKKFMEDELENKKSAKNPDDKKTSENKQEKVELKDIEKKLDEILGE